MVKFNKRSAPTICWGPSKFVSGNRFIKEALQNPGICSISKPDLLRNHSIPNAFGIRRFRSRENEDIR